jgi:hypothetical protein
MIIEGSNILRIGVRKNMGLQAVFEIGLNSVANSYQSPYPPYQCFLHGFWEGSDLGLQLMTTFHLINWQLKTHATTNFVPTHQCTIKEQMKN